MKKIQFCFIVVAFLVLSGSPKLLAQPYPYDNSPSDFIVIPEVIWAPAAYGGVWVSELHITSGYVANPGNVKVYFSYGGGNWRGPFTIWTNPQNHQQAFFPNILSWLDVLDPSFNYWGKFGSLIIHFDQGLKGIAAARTYNGNYGKTFPGLNDTESNTVAIGRNMAIPNLANNSTYRSVIGLYNLIGSPITVKCYVYVAGGWYTGSPITRTLAGYDYQAFDPFVEAGISGNNYDYVTVEIYAESGEGRVMCFGATANNSSNDPAVHIAVNWN